MMWHGYIDNIWNFTSVTNFLNFCKRLTMFSQPAYYFLIRHWVWKWPLTVFAVAEIFRFFGTPPPLKTHFQLIPLNTQLTFRVSSLLLLHDVTGLKMCRWRSGSLARVQIGRYYWRNLYLVERKLDSSPTRWSPLSQLLQELWYVAKNSLMYKSTCKFRSKFSFIWTILLIEQIHWRFSNSPWPRQSVTATKMIELAHLTTPRWATSNNYLL